MIKCQSQFDDVAVLVRHGLLSWLEHNVKKPFIVHATGVSGTDASDTLGVHPNSLYSYVTNNSMLLPLGLVT